jgi:hypothetical protein
VQPVRLLADLLASGVEQVQNSVEDDGVHENAFLAAAAGANNRSREHHRRI